MDFVNDVDLVSRTARTNIHVRAKLADFFDTAIAGAIDLEHIDVFAGINAQADIALIAGCGRWSLNAIQRFGKDAGGRRFSHPPRSSEQICVAYAIRENRIAQRLGDMLLPHQFFEGPRTIAASDNQVLPGGASFTVR
jgi:hypothetical protein